jgi:hypothetical protein
MKKQQKNILWFKEITKNDTPLVGGKNASLGEMYSNLVKKGVNVPNGFALTSKAYWYYLKANKIDKKIKDLFKKFNPKSIKSLEQTSKKAIDQKQLKAQLKKKWKTKKMNKRILNKKAKQIFYTLNGEIEQNGLKGSHHKTKKLKREIENKKIKNFQNRYFKAIQLLRI